MRIGTRPLRAGILAAVAALAVGCGGVGDVAGKVTYKGKPVVTGSVTFYGPDKVPHIAAIDGQGNYKVAGVPSGTCLVTVASPEPSSGAPGGKSGKPSNPNAPQGSPEPKVAPPEGWQPVPAHYGDPQASKLTFEVRGGANTIDIPLD